VGDHYEVGCRKGRNEGSRSKLCLFGAYPSNSGIGIDATVPWNDRDLFERAHYPSDRIDLRNWLTEEQIHNALARQGEYARLLAVTGH